MSARWLAIGSAAFLFSSTLLFSTRPLHAEGPDLSVVPDVDNSKVSFAGVVNANDVYVRSGPGDNYYATMKLDKGAPVTVVGVKFDWLKIIPPDGSYSYVAKAYVEKRGDGTVGRVNRADLNVRAGSDLNEMKTTVQTKIDDGTDVQIIGEQDEYFKIKPPAGAYLYVSKSLVDPVKPLPTVATDAKSSEPIASAPMITRTPDAPAVAMAGTTQPSVGSVAATPTTQSTAVASATTQPATPSAEEQFDAVEAAFLDASNQPLTAQPIDDLQAKYSALTKQDDLPVSMRRIAEMRLSTLNLRAQAKSQYADALKMQQDAQSKQQALKAEQQELEQRVKDQKVTIYTALGTLRTSSLQQNGGTLYRLTDPGTGRTLLYIRSDDNKYAALLNQFIGVRGDIIEDTTMSMKIMTPTVAETVDRTKVNSTVTAEMIPPTLLPKAPTASAGN